MAADLGLEPTLGLEAEERVAGVGGGVAALAEAGDKFAEVGFGCGGERGFGGSGAEGDLLDGVEGFGGSAEADAGELQTVKKKAELGGGAEALVYFVSMRGWNKGEEAGGGFGEAGGDRGGVGRVA